MAKTNNPQQIIRKDGSNCFVEVLNSSFPIGRVLMKFINYDKNQAAGSKFTAEIEIYLTFPAFFNLANKLNNGRLDYMLTDARNKAAAANYKYPIPIVLDMGGKSASKLAAAGKARPDNMSLSRQLKITSGDKYPYLLQAESGPGEEDQKGLIVPRYKQPEQKVLIPLDYDSFSELLLITCEHIRAYLASNYVNLALNPPAPNTAPTTVANNAPAPKYQQRAQAQPAPQVTQSQPAAPQNNQWNAPPVQPAAQSQPAAPAPAAPRYQQPVAQPAPAAPAAQVQKPSPVAPAASVYNQQQQWANQAPAAQTPQPAAPAVQAQPSPVAPPPAYVPQYEETDMNFFNGMSDIDAEAFV